MPQYRLVCRPNSNGSSFVERLPASNNFIVCHHSIDKLVQVSDYISFVKGTTLSGLSTTTDLNGFFGLTNLCGSTCVWVTTSLDRLGHVHYLFTKFDKLIQTTQKLTYILLHTTINSRNSEVGFRHFSPHVTTSLGWHLFCSTSPHFDTKVWSEKVVIMPGY